MEIKLKEISQWEEQQSPRRVRFYISNLILGYATPIRGKQGIYSFEENTFVGAILRVDTSCQNSTLEDIQIELECSLKEFIKKICK